jgi:hypothetical protein
LDHHCSGIMQFHYVCGNLLSVCRRVRQLHYACFGPIVYSDCRRSHCSLRARFCKRSLHLDHGLYYSTRLLSFYRVLWTKWV